MKSHSRINTILSAIIIVSYLQGFFGFVLQSTTWWIDIPAGQVILLATFGI